MVELDASIARIAADIEKMAPNLKAIDKCVHWMTTTIGISLTFDIRLDNVENKLMETEREADQARRDSKTARDAFNDVKKRRSVKIGQARSFNLPLYRCDLFYKAYNHISENIDQVYKDLTKGKAAPMGGVAYLSLEDNEVNHLHYLQDIHLTSLIGTICCRYQVPRHAPHETIP